MNESGKKSLYIYPWRKFPFYLKNTRNIVRLSIPNFKSDPTKQDL